MPIDRATLSREEWEAIAALYNIAGAALEKGRVVCVEPARDAYAIVSAFLVRTSPYILAATFTAEAARDRHTG